jgi:hypothetical protein
MATLVAIPLILRRHRTGGGSGRVGMGGEDDPRRYDIFDFVS